MRPRIDGVRQSVAYSSCEESAKTLTARARRKKTGHMRVRMLKYRGFETVQFCSGDILHSHGCSMNMRTEMSFPAPPYIPLLYYRTCTRFSLRCM